MENIRIIVRGHDYIVVVADSDRFGRNEVMYEGNTFPECINYIKRETGKKKLHLTGCFANACEDRLGNIYPSYMEVR